MSTFLSWTYGFLTPAIIGGLIAGFVGLMYGWFSLLFGAFKLSTTDAWLGGWLFAGVTVLAGVVVFTLFDKGFIR